MYLESNYEYEKKTTFGVLRRIILYICMSYSFMTYYMGGHSGFIDGLAIFGPIILPFIFIFTLYLLNILIRYYFAKYTNSNAIKFSLIAISIVSIAILSWNIFVGPYAPWTSVGDPSWGGRSLSFSHRLKPDIDLFSFVSFFSCWLLIEINNTSAIKAKTLKYSTIGILGILLTIALLFVAN